MLKPKRILHRMLRLSHLDSPRRRAFGALLVLVSVCSLTISVATRYSSHEYSTPHKSTTVQKQVSSEPGRQRLDKGAATWLPPVAQLSLLEPPAVSPAVLPAVQPVPVNLLEQSLCNRPPPSDLLS
jgi:hypothetical protein